MPELLHLPTETHILTTIGVLIAIAFLGSKAFQRLGIPQVVGFIVIGVLLGPSFFNIVPIELSQELQLISQVALGLIGFDIGSHLRLRELRKLGRSILTILVFESLGSFVLVAAGVTLISGNVVTGLLFGAISSATDPASTVDVLAEHDTKGPLTTSLLAVVGLDDGLALVLFSLGSAMAESFLSGRAAPTLLEILELPIYEIGGSLLLGILLGVFLDFLMRRMKSHHDAMAISIAFVFLCVGASQMLRLSYILATMTLGGVLVNRAPDHGRFIRYTIEQAGPVIYVLFFALVGARLQIELLPEMGLIGIAYLILRNLGKFLGAWTGGRVSNATRSVRDNLGFGLFAQCGVAIGLAMTAAERFSAYGAQGTAIGTMLLNVVTATTFVSQIIGPILVKLAVRRAGEIGKAKLTTDVWASEGFPK